MAKTETTPRPEQQKQRRDPSRRQQHRNDHHHDQVSDRRHELREENIILVQRNQLLAQIRNNIARLVMARNRGRAALPGEETEEERQIKVLEGQAPEQKQEKQAGAELQNDERIQLVGRDQKVEEKAHDPAHKHEQELTPDKVNVVAKREIGTAQEQAERTQVQTVSLADEAALEKDLGAPSLDVVSTEKNPLVLQMHIFRSRNHGAKEFDDFARGIQTWLSTLEMEAVRRFHDLHMDPIVEAFEEYVLRMAQTIADLIDKALLLCRLRICQKAAAEIAKLALEMIKRLLREREEDIPLEKMFTWKRVQELQKAELNAESGF